MTLLRTSLRPACQKPTRVLQPRGGPDSSEEEVTQNGPCKRRPPSPPQALITVLRGGETGSLGWRAQSRGH